jgi:hypothetical protein
MLNSVSIVMQTSIGLRMFMRFGRYSSAGGSAEATGVKVPALICLVPRARIRG